MTAPGAMGGGHHAPEPQAWYSRYLAPKSALCPDGFFYNRGAAARRVGIIGAGRPLQRADGPPTTPVARRNLVPARRLLL